MPAMTSVSHGPRSTTRSSRASATGIGRLRAVLTWAVVVAACLWLALCTAVGPLYWKDASIANFSWINAACGIASLGIYLGIVVSLVRHARCTTKRRHHRTLRTALDRIPLPAVHGEKAGVVLGRAVVRGSDAAWKILLILLLGWAWVPVALVSAFGADIFSQFKEFSWSWNQWTGVQQPYIGFFSFVPMDIYPTAHYLWPTHATYLTDQHNIVLTIVYGATGAASRFLTGGNDWGLATLSLLQLVFAAFCLASASNRFLNAPWRGSVGLWRTETRHPGRPELGPSEGVPVSLTHPEYGLSHPWTTPVRVWNGHPSRPRSRDFAGPGMRVLILAFFLTCPLVVFSTISLTKSPLFAFAFTWWFSIGYEIRRTSRDRAHSGSSCRLRRSSLVELVLSTAVMIVSAKYAWYIVLLTTVTAMLADKTHRRDVLIGMAVPAVLIHGAIVLLIAQGVIINGDPIESRGVQLQQIARIAQRNPSAIPAKARTEISAIFNLDQMAESYTPYDADPVKSSGIQSKKVSYRWRSVTKEDLSRFNDAWLRIVVADPVTATDAFLAKSFGYFNVTDNPYVSMDYYIDNDYVRNSTDWLGHWNASGRAGLMRAVRSWSRIPVLGWIVHGNLYVTLTLLIGAAEVVLHRWRSLAWHIPLLALMGVMIMAPANNFERHMLPVVFVFLFLCLQFHRESHVRKPGEAGRPRGNGED